MCAAPKKDEKESKAKESKDKPAAATAAAPAAASSQLDARELNELFETADKRLYTLLRPLGLFLHTDPVLFAKLCRVVRECIKRYKLRAKSAEAALAAQQQHHQQQQPKFDMDGSPIS